MLSATFNIFLDALLWDFSEVDRYGIDAIFMRGGAKGIVRKHSPLYESYIQYLQDIQKQSILNRS
jgi:hypothetical protein